MNRKITLSLFFVILLFGSSMPLNGVYVNQVEQDGIPAPIFISISRDDQVVTDNTVTINDTVSIEYKADRYAVDGLILLGQGSNLTENVTLAESNNFTFTLDSSAKAYSYYSIEINITEYTKFYTWAWYGTITNGTREEISTFDTDRENGDSFHYIWVDDDLTYPVFTNVENAYFDTEINGYRVRNDTQVTITYTVSSPTNTSTDRTVYLAFSDNSTNVFNASTATQVQMSWISYDSETQTHEFAYNYTLNSLVIRFFSAYNVRGWERSNPIDTKSHMITSGFFFSASYLDLHEDAFSDIDLISLNVTVYNQTQNYKTFMRYKIYNETTKDNANWTNIELSVIKNTYIENVTVSNTTITIYNFSLNFTLNVSQSISVQAYIEYFNYTTYLGASTFTIVDSIPNVAIIGEKEIYYSNNATQIIFFNADTAKGNLTTMVLYYGLNSTNLTSSKSVLSEQDLSSYEGNTTITLAEGIYKIMINVTNTLNKTSSDYIYLVIDFVAPSGMATINNETSTLDKGVVTFNLEFIDTGANDTGVARIIINWNDGTVENATGLTTVSHTYYKSGEYTVIFTVYDLANNMYNYSRTISVTVPVENTTTTASTPFSLFSVIFTFFVTVIIIKRRKY